MKKIGKTLYKMDSKGKIRSWEIFAGDNGICPAYSVLHGQLGGKVQATGVEVPKGKNIGRANETSAEAQCLSEAEALYQKQIARKGYTETIPTEVPSLPMLAHKYKDFAHKINWPASVSPKIDGIRCIISIQGGVATATSRTNGEIKFIEHITDELLPLGDIVLDGELYHDTFDFEKITSIVRQKNEPHPEVGELYFHVFDIINDDTYHQRVISLESLVFGFKHTKIVPWYIIKDKSMITTKHKEFVAKAYEGTMIRNLDSKYQLNKRSYDLLKLKNFIDEEFEVVGWKTGKGKHKDIPTFELKMTNGKLFEATPKGSAETRRYYLDNAKAIVGKMATVRFFRYTKKGVPYLPVMVAIRDYE